MWPEESEDFTPDENQTFADLVTEGFTQEEIEDLEAEVHDYDVRKCQRTLAKVADQMLEQGAEPFALAEAMKSVAETIEEAFGEQSD